MRVRLVHILLTFLLFIAKTDAQEVTTQYPLQINWEMVATGLDSVIVLPHQFIRPESFQLKAEGQSFTQNIDYTVDLLRGRIEFHQPPDSGTTIQFSYSWRPWQLPLTYQRFTSVDTVLSGKNDKVVLRPLPSVPSRGFIDPGLNLQRSGSVFRGISLGSDQGMRLQSGLRLQLSGMVTSNIEVVAALTDQNTPIQPEGNTQTLDEIDKVFIHINAPRFQSALGDFVHTLDGTAFGAYSKKLQGAKGSFRTDKLMMTAIAASSKGTFTTQHFMGLEGNQGPYQLSGEEGRREIIVLAGTERVYIDGELMTRGEDNDYTIEYGNGQITFTRNRLITSDSRITVDFEYSDQRFQKSIYGFSGNATLWNDRVRFQTSFIRETDDKDHPLDMSLDDEEIAILADSGDEIDSAVVSGARFVGENGDYVKADSAGMTYFRYAGKDQGAYSVRFSYVGPGQGDYVFQSYGIYRYEGPGRGSYLPLIQLPAAQSHQVWDLSTSINLGKQISVHGEVGVSDRDINLFSPLDDSDNVDVAYQGDLKMDPRKISLADAGLGEFGFQARIRHVGDHFRSLGRMTEIEHGRKWAMNEGSTWGEDIRELSLSYNPISSWSVQSELGQFQRNDGFESKRQTIFTDFDLARLPKVTFHSERIESENGASDRGYWLRQNGTISGQWLGFKPLLVYQGEHRRDAFVDSLSGFRFDEWQGGLAFEREGYRLSFTETIRKDKQYVLDALNPHSTARTDQAVAELSFGRNMTTRMMYTHRSRDYRDPTLEDQKTNLADLQIRATSAKRAIDASLQYRYSTTQVSEMVRDTIHVSEGLGNYRFDEDLQELVPDVDGDLLLRSIQTGQFMPVSEIKLGGEVRVDGRRIWAKRKGLLGFIRSWRSRSLIRIERRDKERQFSTVNRDAFSPKWGADSTTVLGIISLHQDFEYASQGGRLQVRLRLRKDDSENNQLVQEGLIRQRTERSLRMKASPSSQWGILSEISLDNEFKEYSTRAHSNRDIDRISVLVEASYRPKQKIEFALKASLMMAKDWVPSPATQARSIFLIPRVRYSIRNRGQLRIEGEVGQVWADPDIRTIPYEMLRGDQPGRTYRLSALFTYQLTGHVMATLNYRARKEPWRDRVFQTGQVEVRAFF